MREIKFRAWHGDEKQMLYHENSKFLLAFNGLILDTKPLKYEDTKWCGEYRVWGAGISNYMHEFHLMQFTGLKDKNGKEIYEGDIVKNFAENFYVIKWFSKGFEMGSTKAKGRYWCTTNDDWNCCEVIGNIYENPELLEPEA